MLEKRVMALTFSEINRNPEERPTATKLLAEHPFCDSVDNYDFNNTELYAKIKGTWNTT